MSQRDQQRVGRYVAERRGALGLTQGELAESAKVDLKTVWSLEAGERWPRATTRSRIEKALGWSPGDIARVAGGGLPAPDEEQELADLMNVVGTDAFDSKARELIADLPEPERSAVEALYEQLLEAEQARIRLRRVVVPLMRRRRRSDIDDDPGSSGIRAVR